MKKAKIYLNNGDEEYIVKKDQFGVPYVTSEEILNSLIADERYDLALDMTKDLIKMLGDDKSDDRVGYVAIEALKALIKNVDDEASKKLAAGLILILKDIYD
jgi:hypothetical protein